MKHLCLGLALFLTCTLTGFAQSDIRQVDFKNFTYPAQCIGEKASKVTDKNGEFYEEKQEDGYVDRFSLNVFDIKYGDLTADGRDEAIVLSVCNTGGTGNFSEGYIFSMKSGKPTLVGRIPGGDRAYGGLRRTWVEAGFLVVESNDVGAEGGACCPQFIVTTKYKLTGGRLAKSGNAVKVPIDAPERIRFDAGKSGATVMANVSGSGAKKFVVGARAGQMLFVKVTGDQSSVRMISDATVTEGTGGFSAKLARNGDYIFEVLNDSATENEFTVMVRIE